MKKTVSRYALDTVIVVLISVILGFIYAISFSLNGMTKDALMMGLFLSGISTVFGIVILVITDIVCMFLDWLVNYNINKE